MTSDWDSTILCSITEIKYINSLRICDIVHYFNQNSVENQQKIMASYDDFHG